MILARIAAAISVAFGAPQGAHPVRHAATQDKQVAATAIAAAEAKRKRRQEKRRSQPK